MTVQEEITIGGFSLNELEVRARLGDVEAVIAKSDRLESHNRSSLLVTAVEGWGGKAAANLRLSPLLEKEDLVNYSKYKDLYVQARFDLLLHDLGGEPARGKMARPESQWDELSDDELFSRWRKDIKGEIAREFDSLFSSEGTPKRR